MGFKHPTFRVQGERSSPLRHNRCWYFSCIRRIRYKNTAYEIHHIFFSTRLCKDMCKKLSDLLFLIWILKVSPVSARFKPDTAPLWIQKMWKSKFEQIKAEDYLLMFSLPLWNEYLNATLHCIAMSTGTIGNGTYTSRHTGKTVCRDRSRVEELLLQLENKSGKIMWRLNTSTCIRYILIVCVM